MTILLAPAFGRLLPLPLLQPWSWEATYGSSCCSRWRVWADVRRSGRAHPAWKWGIGTILGSLLLTQAIAYSPVGLAIYDR